MKELGLLFISDEMLEKACVAFLTRDPESLVKSLNKHFSDRPAITALDIAGCWTGDLAISAKDIYKEVGFVLNDGSELPLEMPIDAISAAIAVHLRETSWWQGLIDMGTELFADNWTLEWKLGSTCPELFDNTGANEKQRECKLIAVYYAKEKNEDIQAQASG